MKCCKCVKTVLIIVGVVAAVAGVAAAIWANWEKLMALKDRYCKKNYIEVIGFPKQESPSGEKPEESFGPENSAE